MKDFAIWRMEHGIADDAPVTAEQEERYLGDDEPMLCSVCGAGVSDCATFGCAIDTTGSPAALLEELAAAIRRIGHSDDLTPIRNEWMMRLLTRCEAALGLPPGGSPQ